MYTPLTKMKVSGLNRHFLLYRIIYYFQRDNTFQKKNLYPTCFRTIMSFGNLVQPILTILKTLHILHIIRDYKRLHMLNITSSYKPILLIAGRIKEAKRHVHIGLVKQEIVLLEINADSLGTKLIIVSITESELVLIN